MRYGTNDCTFVIPTSSIGRALTNLLFWFRRQRHSFLQPFRKVISVSCVSMRSVRPFPDCVGCQLGQRLRSYDFTSVRYLRAIRVNL